MASVKKVVIPLLILSMLLLLVSCSDSKKEPDAAQTTESTKRTFPTDENGGWFATYGDYRYYTNGTEASIAGYLGTETKLNLPDKYREIPVISIGWSVFAENQNIEEITIPDGIKIIGVGAFQNCTSLKKVTLSDSVTKIDINCFTGCTSLTEINISKNVTEIGISAFSKCTSLTSITCDNENKAFSALSGVLYSKDKDKLIVYPAGKTDEEYTVDEKTVSIFDRAFEGNTYIKTVNLKNVVDIGSYAFKDCYNLLNVKHDKTMVVAGGAFENTFYEATLTTSSSASGTATGTITSTTD